MTPAARIASAIAILDAVLQGAPAEKELTVWARRSRFAGSGDRAAIRDHVFDALRCRRSFAALGGAETGRGIMIGALRAQGVPPETLFTGEGHAPAPLTPVEAAAPRDMSELEQLDCPDWLETPLKSSLGSDFTPVMEALRHRAPVFLRVNIKKSDPKRAADLLSDDGIETRPHPLSPTALEVTQNPRRVQNSRAYRQGLVELQDAASQAVTDRIELPRNGSVLDYCAGGGGKSLAMAARVKARYFAHDVHPRRMQDLPARAGRAGVEIALLGPDGVRARAPYDLVVCDVPCSGSGAWRRSPEGKWALTPKALENLTQTQDRILQDAVGLVADNGAIAYLTCSLLNVENGDRVARFLSTHPGWTLADQARLTPLDGGDGFYFSLLKRDLA